MVTQNTWTATVSLINFAYVLEPPLWMSSVW